MTSLFPASRAAEEFARVIDGTASAAVTERYADLTGTLTLLREQPQPLPSASFVADLRERLLVAADDLLVAAVAGAPEPAANVTPLRPRRARRGERHLGAAAAALLLVGGTAGLAAASQGSLPGDALYPVKRGIESAELRLAGGDIARGKDLMHQAGTRLDELDAVMSGRGASVDQIEATLSDFTSSAGRGSDLIFSGYRNDADGASITSVRQFAAENMGQLAALEKLAPPTAAPAFDQAAELLAEIDQQARVLCVACSAAAPLALPSNLVAPSSARALDTLVSAPAVRADNAVKLAEALRQQTSSEASAAEAAAASLGSSATGGASSTTGSGDEQTSGSAGLLPEVPISRQPIGDLVEGLTSVVGGTGSTGGTLGDTTKKVTDGLDGTIDGLGGALGDTSQKLDDTTGQLGLGGTTP